MESPVSTDRAMRIAQWLILTSVSSLLKFRWLLEGDLLLSQLLQGSTNPAGPGIAFLSTLLCLIDFLEI